MKELNFMEFTSLVDPSIDNFWFTVGNCECR